jgi:signal transduction histidine kinase
MAAQPAGPTRFSLPVFRTISSKVIASFALVVLVQGLMSIVAMRYMTERAMASTLEDQSRRTVALIEKYFDDAYRESLVKAKLLAGQRSVTEAVKSGLSYDLRREIELFRAPLKLDAILVLDSAGRPLVSSGDALMLGIARKTGLGREMLSQYRGPGSPGEVDAMAGWGGASGGASGDASGGAAGGAEAAGKVVLSGLGNKIHMWALYPVLNGGAISGVLCAAVGLDRWFVGRIEEISNTSMLLALRDSILVNGRLSDDVFIAYSRIASSSSEDPAAGSIKSFEYRSVRFASFPELKLVFFLDRSPTRALLGRYVTTTLMLMAATLVFALGMAILLYRYSFWKPFSAFQEAIRTISRGELTYIPSRRTEDEFAELETEFEKMTGNLRKLEERLALSSRMAAIGEMVAGVAHQIRNPLAVMKVSSEMIRDSMDDAKDPAGKVRKLAGMLGSEIDSLEETVSKFLDFTKPLQIHREALDLDDFLSRVLSRIPRSRYPGIEIRKETLPAGARATLDRHLVEQALTNLVLNALQATEGGGTVRVFATLSDSLLTIGVEDSGRGMSEEVRARIFDPFFTTKSDGTGLGLSVAHRIVESHGGSILVESGRGSGSTVKMIIPEAP